jgi:hypothetical protein
MADADYRAWVEVLPDFKDFNSTVQSAVVGGMAGSATSGATAFGGGLVAGIGKYAGPIALAIAGLGIAGGIADAVRTGIDAGLSYLSRSVQLASDLNESLNAVNVAYGEHADAVLALGENAPKQFALTSLALNDFAVRFSNFSQRIAGDGGDVAGTLGSIIQRGTDFASVYNLEVEEALRLFQSGLAGEMEPLRRYGIDLSMATVQSYAYAAGIAEQGKQLNDTQRLQAAYLALMDQTAITAGDFENTQDELANSTRQVQAAFEQAQIELGHALLPVLTDVMLFVRDELVPMWEDFNEQIGPELGAALDEAWPLLKELAELILPLIPPAIEAIIDGFRWLSESFQVIITFTNLVAGTFSDFFALLRGDISIDQFVSRFLERLNAWWTALGERVSSAFGFFVDFGNNIVAEVANIGARLFEGGKAMIQRFIDGIRQMFGPVGDAVGGLMDWVAGFFPNSPAKRGPLSGVGWRAIGMSGAAIVDQFESGLRTVDLSFSGAVSVGGRPELSAVAGGFGAGVRDVHLHTTDPYVGAAMLKQELGGKLAGVV